MAARSRSASGREGPNAQFNARVLSGILKRLGASARTLFNLLPRKLLIMVIRGPALRFGRRSPLCYPVIRSRIGGFTLVRKGSSAGEVNLRLPNFQQSGSPREETV